MPPLVRQIDGMANGIPGSLMWTAGGINLVFAGVVAFSKGEWPSAEIFLMMGIAVVAWFLGFLMLVAGETFSIGKRYGFATRHLPRCIALELGVQVLIGLSFVFFFGGFGNVIEKKYIPAAIYEALLVVFGISANRLFKRLTASRKEWMREARTKPQMVS